MNDKALTPEENKLADEYQQLINAANRHNESLQSRIAELERENKRLLDNYWEAGILAEKLNQHNKTLMGLLEKQVKGRTWSAVADYGGRVKNMAEFQEAFWQSYCKDHNIENLKSNKQ